MFTRKCVSVTFVEEYSKRLEYEVCGSPTVLVVQYARCYSLVPFHLSFTL